MTFQSLISKLFLISLRTLFCKFLLLSRRVPFFLNFRTHRRHRDESGTERNRQKEEQIEFVYLLIFGESRRFAVPFSKKKKKRMSTSKEIQNVKENSREREKLARTNN
jgi:hypothetical protein